jgi:hypothetical protein
MTNPRKDNLYIVCKDEWDKYAVDNLKIYSSLDLAKKALENAEKDVNIHVYVWNAIKNRYEEDHLIEVKSGRKIK